MASIPETSEGSEEPLIAARVIEHVAAPTSAELGHDFTGQGGMTAQVEHALRHVQEHGHAVRALLVGGGGDEFIRALRTAAFNRLREVTDDYAARFLTGALVETVVWWAETGYSDDPHTLAESYAELAGAGLR